MTRSSGDTGTSHPSVVVRTCRARVPPRRRRDRAPAGSGSPPRASGSPDPSGRVAGVPGHDLRAAAPMRYRSSPGTGWTAVVTAGDAREYGCVPVSGRTTLYRVLAVRLPAATIASAERRALCEPTGGLEPPTARLQVGCATSCATPAGHGNKSRDKDRDNAGDNSAAASARGPGPATRRGTGGGRSRHEGAPSASRSRVTTGTRAPGRVGLRATSSNMSARAETRGALAGRSEDLG